MCAFTPMQTNKFRRYFTWTFASLELTLIFCAREKEKGLIKKKETSFLVREKLIIGEKFW